MSSTTSTDAIERQKPTAAAGDFRQAAPGGPRRPRLGLRLHHLLFLAFTLIAALPIWALALWDQSVAYQHELTSVRERHLLVARNLTTALSRYVEDVKAAFSLTFESGAMRTQDSRTGAAPRLAERGATCASSVRTAGWSYSSAAQPSTQPAASRKELLADLRGLAASADGKPR